MNTFIVFLFTVLTIITFSESCIPHFYLHRIANAVTKLRDPIDGSKYCVDDTECIKIEKCIHQWCRDPCPGSCGINANCNVANHTMSCSCPKCYTGDAYKSCTPFHGLNNLICQFGRFINQLGGA